MALRRNGSSKASTGLAGPREQAFWASAGTIDVSTRLHGDVVGTARTQGDADATAFEQLNARVEVGFKLKMPEPRPQRRVPPPTSPPENVAFDIRANEQEDYYVVSTTVRPPACGASVRRSIGTDDIYISSQQRDVLHACPRDVQSVLERAASRTSGHVKRPDPRLSPSEDDIDALVTRFLEAGGTRNHGAEELLLRGLLERSEGRRRLDIGSWLKEQVIASSMDTKGAHIRDLLQTLAQLDDEDSHPGASRRLAVCFCGPNGLAQSLSAVAREMNVQFEYLAHAD
jgi:hypothetical protein